MIVRKGTERDSAWGDIHTQLAAVPLPGPDYTVLVSWVCEMYGTPGMRRVEFAAHRVELHPLLEEGGMAEVSEALASVAAFIRGRTAMGMGGVEAQTHYVAGRVVVGAVETGLGAEQVRWVVQWVFLDTAMDSLTPSDFPSAVELDAAAREAGTTLIAVVRDALNAALEAEDALEEALKHGPVIRGRHEA